MMIHQLQFEYDYSEFGFWVLQHYAFHDIAHRLANWLLRWNDASMQIQRMRNDNARQ